MTGVAAAFPGVLKLAHPTYLHWHVIEMKKVIIDHAK